MHSWREDPSMTNDGSSHRSSRYIKTERKHDQIAAIKSKESNCEAKMSPRKVPHVVLVPLPAQGHMIPMVDLGILLAQRRCKVTIAVTNGNADRIMRTVDKAANSQLSADIKIHKMTFPSSEVKLPDGLENLAELPSRELLLNFYRGLAKLQSQLEAFMFQCESQGQNVSCIVADKYIYWVHDLAKKFGIKRFVFHGMGCFSLLVSLLIRKYVNLSEYDDNDSLVVPFLPETLKSRFKLTKKQLPGEFLRETDFDTEFRPLIQKAESEADGIIVNSFTELEGECCHALAREMRKKVWCVGPVFFCHRKLGDSLSHRGAQSNAGCLNWLGRQEHKSVVFASLGSLCRLDVPRLMEIGYGLKGSEKPFLWVACSVEHQKELTCEVKKADFENSLVITDWAPQLEILSHSATAAFLTHCGWNSTLEGICAGLPLITYPVGAEQFLNEKLAVDVLKIGVSAGAKTAVSFGKEKETSVSVEKHHITNAILTVMNNSEMAKKCSELQAAAAEAFEGGSSYHNMSDFIGSLTFTPPSSADLLINIGAVLLSLLPFMFSFIKFRAEA